LSPDAIDLDAYQKPTLSASASEKEAFNITTGKIMAKQIKGDFVVAKELLYELSRVLYGVNVESEMGHMPMEIPNYVGWKTSDPECPNFSQYLAQMKTLVTFLDQPRANHRPITHLVDELRDSQTCGWNSSWNRDQQVCLNSDIVLIN
jgi:predicted nucleotidyltransferase